MVLEYNNIHITKATLTISLSQHLSKNHFLGTYYMAVCVRDLEGYINYSSHLCSQKTIKFSVEGRLYDAKQNLRIKKPRRILHYLEVSVIFMD